MVLIEMLLRGRRANTIRSLSQINSLDIMVGTTFLGVSMAAIVPMIVGAAAPAVVEKVIK